MPYALKLESGDLLVMARDSRRVYHGLARIIQNTFKGYENSGNKNLSYIENIISK